MSYLVTILIKQIGKPVEQMIEEIFQLFGDNRINDLTFENENYSVDIIELDPTIRFNSKDSPIEQSISEFQKEGVIRILIQRQNENLVANFVDTDAEAFQESMNHVYQSQMSHIENIDDDEPKWDFEPEPEVDSLPTSDLVPNIDSIVETEVKKPNPVFNFTPLKNSIRIADNSLTKLPVTDLNEAPQRGADSNLHRYKNYYLLLGKSQINTNDIMIQIPDNIYIIAPRDLDSEYTFIQDNTFEYSIATQSYGSKDRVIDKLLNTKLEEVTNEFKQNHILYDSAQNIHKWKLYSPGDMIYNRKITNTLDIYPISGDLIKDNIFNFHTFTLLDIFEKIKDSPTPMYLVYFVTNIMPEHDNTSIKIEDSIDIYNYSDKPYSFLFTMLNMNKRFNPPQTIISQPIPEEIEFQQNLQQDLEKDSTQNLQQKKEIVIQKVLSNLNDLTNEEKEIYESLSDKEKDICIKLKDIQAIQNYLTLHSYFIENQLDLEKLIDLFNKDTSTTKIWFKNYILLYNLIVNNDLTTDTLSGKNYKLIYKIINGVVYCIKNDNLLKPPFISLFDKINKKYIPEAKTTFSKANRDKKITLYNYKIDGYLPMPKNIKTKIQFTPSDLIQPENIDQLYFPKGFIL